MATRHLDRRGAHVPTPEAKIALVRKLYDAMAARDLDTILSLVDPEVMIVQTPELPWGGEHQGLEGLATFYGVLTDTINSKVEHDELFAAGNRVVQVGRTRGTVIASGSPFDIREVHIWTIREGKIIRFEAYIDTPAMLAALALS